MTDRLHAFDLQCEPVPPPSRAVPDPPDRHAATPRDDRAPSPAVCPLCHTTGPAVSSGALETSLWTCGRCGQRWSGQRIATVEAYMRFADSRMRG